MAQQIYVSVIIPIRNEERYIRECLGSLIHQTYPESRYEILVVDGRSSDRSKEVVATFLGKFANLKCIDNPLGTAPAGMNAGIRKSQGRIIIRADGHNRYPCDYVANSVKYLEETGADNVGGPWLTTAGEEARFGARLVVALLSNPFGVGDSRFRTSNSDGFVETVPFGAYRRELFERIGFFNERLVRNQDNEFNARIRKAGGRIFQAAALRTEYHPIASFTGLLKQTLKQTQWHIFSTSQTLSAMGVRHFIPALFLTSVLLSGLVSFVYPATLYFLATLLACYFSLGYFWAVRKSAQHGVLIVLVLPLACFLFHVAYGWGTLLGIRYLISSPPAIPIRPGLETDREVGIDG